MPQESLFFAENIAFLIESAIERGSEDPRSTCHSMRSLMR